MHKNVNYFVGAGVGSGILVTKPNPFGITASEFFAT